jgi:hypothetical protein
MAVVVSVVGDYNGKQIDRAQAQLNKLKGTVESASGKSSSAFSKMGSVFSSVAGRIGSALVGIGIGRWLKESLDAAKAAQVINARLAASVNATGQSYAKLQPKIDAAVGAMSRFSGFGKGALKSALADLTQRTGSLTKAQSLMGLAMDVARAKGMPVEDAAKKLGMVLAGNTRVLKEFGIKAVKGGTAAQYLAQIQKKAAGQAAAYGNTFAGAQDKFNNALKGMQVTVGTSLLPYASKAMDAIAQLIGKFDQLPQPAKDVIVAIAGIAAAMLIANASLGPVGAIVAGVAMAGLLIYQNWGKIAPLFDGIGKKLAPLKAGWDQVVSGFTGKGDPKAMATPFSTFGTKVRGVFDNVKQGAVAFGGDLVGAWSKISSAVAAGGDGGIGKAFGSIGTALSGAFESIKTALAPTIAAIMPTIIGFAVSMRDNFKFVVDWVVQNMPLIKATIAEVMTTIGRVITQAVAVITAVWSVLGPIIVPVVTTVFNVIKTVISTTLQVVLGIIKFVMQAITGNWRGAWQTLVSTVSTLLSGLWKIVTTLLSGLVKIVLAVAKPMLDAGKKIVDGIRTGISNAWSNLKSWFTGLFGDLIGIAKRILGIKSPSRVFADIGRNMALGLAFGMDGTRSAVSAAAGRMIGATGVAVPAFGMPALPSSGAPRGFGGLSRSGGGSTLTIYAPITISPEHISDRYDVEELAQDLHDSLLRRLRAAGVPA